eukprot:scaffold33857_cov21-Prasinocladus_malaysianus.AAC.1
MQDKGSNQSHTRYGIAAMHCLALHTNALSIFFQDVSSCLPSDLTGLSVGTQLTVRFAVFDYGTPPLLTTVNRTLVIVNQCGAQAYVCDGMCSPVECNLRDDLIAAVAGPTEDVVAVNVTLVGPEHLEGADCVCKWCFTAQFLIVVEDERKDGLTWARLRLCSSAERDMANRLGTLVQDQAVHH